MEYNITKDVFDYRVGNFDYFDPKYAKEFSFANLMAQNYYMQLDRILEKDKSISFKYSNDSQSRLKLLSVSFLSSNEEIVNNYTLTYNELKLPPYNSKQSDKWGYYNNKHYGNTNYENLSAYRTPNETSMQAEILTGITYPTGGKSEFVYQAHHYSKVAEQFDFTIKPMIGIAGGLRIKEIKNTENGKTSTREFEYADSLGSSSGILSGNHIYYASGRQHIKFHYGRWWGLVYENIKVDYKATYYIMQESNINQLSTTNGNHVTYSRIIEKLPDGGKTIYTYSNHDKFMDGTPVKILDNINNEILANSFISKELERGLLLKTEFFNKYGTPVKAEINTYNSSPERYNDFVKSINQMRLVNGNVQRISALKIYTFCPYLESQTTIAYDTVNNKSLTSTAKFEYNGHKLLAKKSTVNSKGEEEVDVMRYVGDMQNGIYTQMKDKNMIGFPVEKTSVRNDKVVRSLLSTYKKNERNNDYVIDKEYKAMFGFPLPYSQFVHFTGTSKDSHYNLPEVEYTKYDSYSNISGYLSKDFHATTCFWGYNGTYPTAVFEGARNNYKVTAKYEDVWTTKSIALKHNASYQNSKEYSFYTSKPGSVEFHLSGAMGYNWYVTGSFDGKPIVHLIQIRTAYTDEPWWRYQNAYSYKVVVNGVLPGYHTFRISATDSYKDKSTGDYDGELYYSYWKSESIAPEIKGNDDAFYENFESAYQDDMVPFGFHSSQSYAGPYTVSLPTNPAKNYTIDYQVFKNGKWNYSCHDFKNGAYTINEDNNPIDEVRVYPKDAIATSFTYFPFIGLRSKTTGGYTESYEYEPYGRLSIIKDNNQKIIKAFDYKYYNQTSGIISNTFYNIEVKKEFEKEDCDSLRGEIGQSIQYIVPVGKYSSTISQEDANRKAYDDLVRNGQQYANENGECSNDIILSVYNPNDITYRLEFMWGAQGSIRYDNYQIPPNEKIADTGDILQDYKPIIIYIPRRNYRNATAYQGDDYNSESVDLSIKSSEYKFDLFYDINYYPDYRDTYVIGGYPFIR